MGGGWCLVSRADTHTAALWLAVSGRERRGAGFLKASRNRVVNFPFLRLEVSECACMRAQLDPRASIRRGRLEAPWITCIARWGLPPRSVSGTSSKIFFFVARRVRITCRREVCALALLLLPISLFFNIIRFCLALKCVSGRCMP